MDGIHTRCSILVATTYYSIRSNCGALRLSVLTVAGSIIVSLATPLSLEVTVPAEEASQEVNHAKIDATINTSGVLKRLGCDSLEKCLRTSRRYLRMRSRVCARREVHLRMRRYVSARREVHLRMRSRVSARREVHLRMRSRGLRTPKTFARVRRCVSARGERLLMCGAGSPHAKNVCPHAELALRTRRTYVRMRSWPSAYGNGRRAGNCTSRLPHFSFLHSPREL